MKRLLIIGGSDAGISAALRAREQDETVEVTVIVEDAFPNYSICGLPFYLSGEVPDFHALAHRTQQELTSTGLSLLLNHQAQSIDPNAHTVLARRDTGEDIPLSYDSLLLATGARPKRPGIVGIDLPGVFLLHTMADSFAVEQFLTKRMPRTALIVGGGYIGVEMADALTVRGLAVTLVEHGASVLKTIDPSMGTFVRTELERHNVRVETGIAVHQIEQHRGRLSVWGTPEFEAEADLVLVAVGVQPRSELAHTAGVEVGMQGAVCVSRAMETNILDLYAAGDCVETWHHVLKEPTYLPLGTTSHKQGRVAGENMVGGHREFAGTLGTQVVKVFDLAVARTGLREDEARGAGFDPLTVEGTYFDHKVYYPGAKSVQISLTGDRSTGRLLGAQLVGPVQTEVAKRIDILATALFHEMTVEALSDLDLSYTPPLASPWDLVQMAAQKWKRALRRETNDRGNTHAPRIE